MVFQPPKKELASEIGSLYKYRKIDCPESFRQTSDMIKERSLWFWHVTGQNDENECKPKVTFDGTKKQKYEYFIDDFKQAYPHFSNKLLKKWARKASKKPKIPSSSLVYDYWAICCFTAKANCPYLWTEYGGNEKGLVIEYEAREGSSIGLAGKVKYTDEQILLNLLQLTEEKCYEIFTTKQKKWAREKEYRMVMRLNKSKSGGNFTFSDIKINSVQIGKELEEKYRKEIHDLCLSEKIKYIENK